MASPATASALFCVSLVGLPMLTDYRLSDEWFQSTCMIGTILDLLAYGIHFSWFSACYIDR